MAMKVKAIIAAITINITFLLYSTLQAQILEQDSLALVAFYNSTGGPGWTNNTGWLTEPVSTWFGVTVEGNRVTRLSIYDNNLNGFIPSDIGNLNNLTNLALGYEPMLYGIIPSEIGQVLELRGLFIGNCANMRSLQLFGNLLSGSIPLEIGNLDSLLTLELHDNQLSGPIPPEIGNCSQLLELRLNNNQLSGAIPPSLANCTQIQTLYLHNNSLTGEIPYELSQVSSYFSLAFANNHLTGIPPWTPNWILNDLAIGGNCMTFEDLEPHFVGYMWYSYYPQDSMQTVIDTLLPNGSNFNIYSGSLGQYTTYSWFHDGVYMPGAENADTLKLINISEADAGTYICHAQSSKCKDPNGMPMVLFRRPVNIDITVGMGEPDAQNVFTVYPNPCTDYLEIETTLRIFDGKLNLTDIYGQLIKSETWTQSAKALTLNIASLPDGIYILTLQDKKHIFMQKIVIN